MALIDNIVSYWTMDGDSVDELGTNSGTDTDMSYGSSVAIINESGTFNGSTSKITKTSSSLPTGSSARSFNFWFRKDTTGDQVLAMYGTASTAQMWYMGASGTNIIFYGIARDYTPSYTMSADTWYMATYTYDGTTLRIYMNGSEVGSGATLALNTASSTTFTIGDDTWVGSPLDGYIDEMGCWSRDLSSSEVTELYNSGSGLAYPFTAGTTFTPKVTIF